MDQSLKHKIIGLSIVAVILGGLIYKFMQFEGYNQKQTVEVSKTLSNNAPVRDLDNTNEEQIYPDSVEALPPSATPIDAIEMIAEPQEELFEPEPIPEVSLDVAFEDTSQATIQENFTDLDNQSGPAKNREIQLGIFSYAPNVDVLVESIKELFPDSGSINIIEMDTEKGILQKVILKTPPISDKVLNQLVQNLERDLVIKVSVLD